MPHLHLPVQSGSDRILKAMNRGHRREDYLRIVDRIRTARPDIALSSDFIVGFPGETDADFEATLALVREVDYAQAFSFKYSARAGTPAAVSGRQVSQAIKVERLEILQALLSTQQQTFNSATIGRVFPVLFEKTGRLPGQGVGRSPYLQAVHVDAAAPLIGQLRDIRVSAALANSVKGVLAENSVASIERATAH